MRVTFGLPTHRVDRFDEFCTSDAVAEMAAACERAGFDAVFVTEHPIPGDEWLATGGHHALDPFVALAFAAAATTTLRLHTNLFVPAYRHPYVGAKAVATLDAMSGGRVILGVGTGYLEEEFAALEVPFDDRNERVDRAIRMMREVWSGASVPPGNSALPLPVQQPGPPIWIGGNSRRAVRRAAELGDGWSPMPAPARVASRVHTSALETVADLAERIALLRELAGDRHVDVAFMPSGGMMGSRRVRDPDEVVASAEELAAVGVTWLVTGVPGETRAELLDNVAGYGENVLRRLPTS